MLRIAGIASLVGIVIAFIAIIGSLMAGAPFYIIALEFVIIFALVGVTASVSAARQ